MTEKTEKKDYLIPNEPHKFTEKDFNSILIHLNNIDGSDVYMQSGDRIIMDVSGFKRKVSRNPISFDSMEVILKEIIGENAVGRLNSGEPIDDEYETKLEIDGEIQRFRYRMNFTGVKKHGKDGIQATIRSIPVTPPPLEKIGLSREDLIYKSFFPLQGLILVTGPTGSGKSTLMASCVAELLGEAEAHRVFNTYESPIEFVYDEIDSPSCLITQSSVPQNCKSFKKGIENSLRRKPEIIIVGEMRDRETIAAAIEAAQTGHLVIGTAHTNGVPETIRRLINTFDSSERESIQSDIVDCLQFIVAQRLLKTVDGKRTAVREYLKFTQGVKERLLNVDSKKINLETRKILNEKNISMEIDAREQMEQGIVLEAEYLELADTFAFEK
jgi:defect-in-organelle-trafficking protein DotB